MSFPKPGVPLKEGKKKGSAIQTEVVVCYDDSLEEPETEDGVVIVPNLSYTDTSPFSSASSFSFGALSLPESKKTKRGRGLSLLLKDDSTFKTNLFKCAYEIMYQLCVDYRVVSKSEDATTFGPTAKLRHQLKNSDSHWNFTPVTTAGGILNILRELSPEYRTIDPIGVEVKSNLAQLEDRNFSRLKKHKKHKIHVNTTTTTAALYALAEMAFRIFWVFGRDDCNPVRCPQMSASDDITYRWSDGIKAIELPALTYVEKLHESAFAELKDITTSKEPEKQLLLRLRKVAKRLFRIPSHVYYRHAFSENSESGSSSSFSSSSLVSTTSPVSEELVAKLRETTPRPAFAKVSTVQISNPRATSDTAPLQLIVKLINNDQCAHAFTKTMKVDIDTTMEQLSEKFLALNPLLKNGVEYYLIQYNDTYVTGEATLRLLGVTNNEKLFFALIPEAPIHVAVTALTIDVIERINAYSNPQILDENNRNLFHALALSTGTPEEDILKLLTKKKVSPLAVDKFGNTPIFYAIQSQKLKMLHYLLHHFPAGFAIPDEKGRYPVHRLCAMNDPKITEEEKIQLVSDMVKVAPFHQRDSFGNFPLHYACAEGGGDIRLVSIFLDEYGIEADIRNSSTLETPLFLATKHRHIHLANYLVKMKGATRLVMNSEGILPLDLAYEYEHPELIKTLSIPSLVLSQKLIEGTRAETLDKFRSAFSAELKRLRQIVAEQQLAGSGTGDFEKKRKEMINQCILLCAFRGKIQFVEFVLAQHEADLLPNFQIEKWTLPGALILNFSREHDYIILLDSLLTKDTILQRYNRNRTINHIAIVAENTCAIQLLMARGGSINLFDKNGLTELHLAVLMGNSYILRDLLSLGCDPLMRDLNGETPIEMAVRMKRPDLVTLCNHHLGIPCEPPPGMTLPTQPNLVEVKIFRTRSIVPPHIKTWRPYVQMSHKLAGKQKIFKSKEVLSSIKVAKCETPDDKFMEEELEELLRIPKVDGCLGTAMLECCRIGNLKLIKYLVERKDVHPLFVHGKGAPEIVPVEKDVPPVETAPPGIPTGRASLSTSDRLLFEKARAAMEDREKMESAQLASSLPNNNANRPARPKRLLPGVVDSSSPISTQRAAAMAAPSSGHLNSSTTPNTTSNTPNPLAESAPKPRKPPMVPPPPFASQTHRAPSSFTHLPSTASLSSLSSPPIQTSSSLPPPPATQQRAVSHRSRPPSSSVPPSVDGGLSSGSPSPPNPLDIPPSLVTPTQASPPILRPSISPPPISPRPLSPARSAAPPFAALKTTSPPPSMTNASSLSALDPKLKVRCVSPKKPPKPPKHFPPRNASLRVCSPVGGGPPRNFGFERERGEGEEKKEGVKFGRRGTLEKEKDKEKEKEEEKKLGKGIRLIRSTSQKAEKMELDKKQFIRLRVGENREKGEKGEKGGNGDFVPPLFDSARGGRVKARRSMSPRGPVNFDREEEEEGNGSPDCFPLSPVLANNKKCVPIRKKQESVLDELIKFRRLINSDSHTFFEKSDTPITIAKNYKHHDVLQYLKSAEQDLSTQRFRGNGVPSTLTAMQQMLFCPTRKELPSDPNLEVEWMVSSTFVIKKGNEIYREMELKLFAGDSERPEEVHEVLGRSLVLFDFAIERRRKYTLTLCTPHGPTGEIDIHLYFRQVELDELQKIEEEYVTVDPLDVIRKIKRASGQKRIGKARKALGGVPRFPILIVPGLASSALEAYDTDEKEWLRERVWIDPFKIGKLAVLEKVSKKLSRKPTKKDLSREKKEKGEKKEREKKEKSEREEREEEKEEIVKSDNAERKRKWIAHMVLANDGFSDPPGIRVRAVPGLHGIDYLAQVSVARAQSYVFSHVIRALIDFGYDYSTLDACSYDWRLPPEKLQERDNYFVNLKKKIEAMHEHQNRKVVLLAHSMGNRVVQYFLKWMEMKGDLMWMDQHIQAFLALGAPFLGSSKALRTVLCGDAMGLEVFLTKEEALLMARVSSSLPWLFPVGISSYPDEIIRVANEKSGEGQLPYIPQQFESVLQTTVPRSLKFYEEFYQTNPLYLYSEEESRLPPIMDPPPIDRVWVLNGINRETEVGYYMRGTKVMLDPSADKYSHKKLAGINPRGLLIREGIAYESKDTFQPSIKIQKSGDGTVPFCSLNFAETSWKDDVHVFTVEIDDAEHREMLNNDAIFNEIITFVSESLYDNDNESQHSSQPKKLSSKTLSYLLG